MTHTKNALGLAPVVTFCITHTDPLIPPSDYTINLEIGPPGTLDPERYKRIAHCFDLVPYGEQYRQELGSTLGSFAARHYLLKHFDSLDFAVNIATYRTFMMADKRPGKAADKRPGHFHKTLKLNMLTNEEARHLGDFVLPHETHSMWRLPTPIPLSSLAQNYAQSHHLEDLDLYLEIARAEGVLTLQESADWWEAGVLLGGALSVGMMPARVFCDLNEQLERVTREFLRRFSSEGRDNYQIRAANFCHERLGSYLLEKHMLQEFGRLPETHFGYWARVDDNMTLSRGHM